MAQKIKFSFIKMFFRLFSFLADRTGGWKIFVQPKLVLGTALILSGTAYAQKPVNQNNSVREELVNCYDPAYVPPPSDTIVHEFVPVKARFPGGDAALMKWLFENIQYPESAKEAGIQDRVFVRFVVRKDGSIDNVKITGPSTLKEENLENFRKLFEQEAIRLIKTMPRWQAGENDKGQKVSSYFTIPVKFVLK